MRELLATASPQGEMEVILTRRALNAILDRIRAEIMEDIERFEGSHEGIVTAIMEGNVRNVRVTL